MNDESVHGDVPVHRACGFPVARGRDGGWVHAEAADAVFCDLLFSGGSMLDALIREED